MNRLLILISLALSVLVGVESRWGSAYYREDWNLGHLVSTASHEYIAHDVFNTSSPKCTSRAGHKVRCFFATSKNTVAYAIFSGKKLKDLRDYGGSVKHQPQVSDFGYSGNVAFFIDDRHHIVAMGIDTNMSFERTPTIISQVAFSEAPSCVSLEEGAELFCLARGMDGVAKSLRFREGVWEKPVSIGPNPNTPIGCVANPIARLIKCWASYGRNNAISERLWSLQGEVVTSSWSRFSQKSRGRPCVKQIDTLTLPRALDYDTNSMVDQYRLFNGDDVFSEPECASADSDTFDCFGIGEYGQLQRMVQSLGLFSARRVSHWFSYYTIFFKGNPSCLYLSHDQHYHCYMTSRNNTLFEGVFEAVDPRPGNVDVAVQVAF